MSERRPVDEEWLLALNHALGKLRDQSLPDGAGAEIDWLLMRCRNTLDDDGPRRGASLEQLKRDVADLLVAFPGLLPDELARELSAR